MGVTCACTGQVHGWGPHTTRYIGINSNMRNLPSSLGCWAGFSFFSFTGFSFFSLTVRASMAAASLACSVNAMHAPLYLLACNRMMPVITSVIRTLKLVHASSLPAACAQQSSSAVSIATTYAHLALGAEAVETLVKIVWAGKQTCKHSDRPLLTSPMVQV